MRFAAAHVDAFARLSHDVNPLHVDPSYAAATAFHRVVVHGMCGVLCALGAWAGGRRFALCRLRATFRRPVYTDEDYVLAASETGQRVTLRWTAAGESHADVSFTWEPFSGEEAV